VFPLIRDPVQVNHRRQANQRFDFPELATIASSSWSWHPDNCSGFWAAILDRIRDPYVFRRPDQLGIDP